MVRQYPNAAALVGERTLLAEDVHLTRGMEVLLARHRFFQALRLSIASIPSLAVSMNDDEEEPRIVEVEAEEPAPPAVQEPPQVPTHDLSVDVWTKIGKHLLELCTTRSNTVSRLFQLRGINTETRAAADYLSTAAMVRSGMWNASARRWYTQHLLNGRVIEMEFKKIGVDGPHTSHFSLAAHPPPPVTGSPSALAEEGARVHALRGMLLWQPVDKQFHVPLEDGRGFRVDVSPLALLQCTCICDILGPQACHVHAVTPPRGMVHRVVGDAVALVCEHLIPLTSSSPCEHPQCANKFAAQWQWIHDCMHVPMREEVVVLDAIPVVGAASSSSDAGPSVEPAPEPVPACLICLDDLSEVSEQLWGKLKCCGAPMHCLCLFRWMNISKESKSASTCPNCRKTVNMASKSRAFV